MPCFSWHRFGDSETTAHKNAVQDDWRTKIGRDPGEIERSASFKGTASQTSANAEALADVGVNLFMLVTDEPGYDMSWRLI